MGDVDLPAQPRATGALGDELELEGAQLTTVVQVDVDTDPAPLGDLEQPVELLHRVAVDRRRVESADTGRPVRRRLVQQVQDAGPADHPVLRERDDLHLDRAAERLRRPADGVDPPQADTQVDVDVAAHRGDAVPQELPQHREAVVHAGNAERVPLGPLVRDASRDGGLAAVGHPWAAPPALVHMGVRVDEAGQGEQSSAVHTLTGLARGTGGYQVADLPVGDDDVDGRHAPGADIGQSQISHAEMVYRGAVRRTRTKTARRARRSRAGHP